MELEINGQKTDLGNQVIAITRKALDIENLTLKSIDITNRIKLPFTNKNHQIFNSAYILNSDNDYLDRIYKAKVIDQFFLFNGTAFLIDAQKNYNIQLAEDSKSFFNNLNNLINQLDVDQYDFTFNYTYYLTLRLQSSSLWVWPVTSMHGKKTTTQTPIPPTSNADLKYSRPMISFKSLLELIFDNQGWTLEHDLSLLDELCISTNHEKFYFTSYQKTIDQTYVVSGTSNIDGLNVNDFEETVITTNTTIDILEIPTIFRLRGNIIVDSDFEIIFKITNDLNEVEEQVFSIKSTDTEIDIITDTFGDFDESPTSNEVEIVISGTGSFEFDNTLLYTLIEEQDLGDLDNAYFINYMVKTYDNLPEKTQLEIFRDALILTNSIIVPDSLNKKIEIKSLNKISKLNSVDWSDKFVQQSEKISPKISGYGQKNYVQYNNDDIAGEETGKSFFYTENESLNDIETVIELNYSASKEITIDSERLADMTIYDDTERINELTVRLISFREDGTSSYTLSGFNEIDWKTLKENYYQDFFYSLSRIRKVEALFNLSKLDVLGFDFTQLIYVRDLKSYFFCLAIDDFVPRKLTKVTLLKWL